MLCPCPLGWDILNKCLILSVCQWDCWYRVLPTCKKKAFLVVSAGAFLAHAPLALCKILGFQFSDKKHAFSTKRVNAEETLQPTWWDNQWLVLLQLWQEHWKKGILVFWPPCLWGVTWGPTGPHWTTLQRCSQSDFKWLLEGRSSGLYALFLTRTWTRTCYADCILIS